MIGHQACRNNGSTPGEPRVARLGAGLAMTIGLLVALPGCPPDTRTTLKTLHQAESDLAATTQPTIDPRQVALTELRPYTIAAGDVLSLDFTGLEAEFAHTQVKARVRSDGSVALPLVGFVKLGGKTLASAEEAIHSAFVPSVLARLSVFVEAVDSETTTVLVSGAALQPGVVNLKRNERNVLYAVARASGFGSTTGRVRVQPLRPERAPQVYQLDRIDDLRAALLAPPLESGDLVYIEPAEASQVYLTGLVNTPGAIPVPRNATISFMRALSASGGLVDFLEPKEATLWRQLSDGRQMRVKLELASILAGETADFDLRAGDVIDIPHTPETRFRQWFAQNIRIGPFGVTAIYDPIADRRARILKNDNNDNTFQRSLLQSLGTGIPEAVIPQVPVP